VYRHHTIAASAAVHTKAAADGMEFTLDAATLEQLRARGDASAIIDPSAFGESATGYD